jgi:hypothetical protein
MLNVLNGSRGLQRYEYDSAIKSYTLWMRAISSGFIEKVGGSVTGTPVVSPVAAETLNQPEPKGRLASILRAVGL